MDKIQAALSGRRLVLRISGRGSFKHSKEIKEYILDRLEKDANICIFDLKECVSMDSTFMGMLAGLSFILKPREGKAMYLANLNLNTRNLLNTLGLMNFILEKQIEELSDKFQFKELNFKEAKTTGVAKHMLESHKALVKIDDKNRKSFKAVVKSLEDSIKKDKKDKEK
ncbi:MAG: STAS domain-containing protein [Candidatus Aureabacteria bacterium]|nr:STAS domain-containing protein [Candidatus Auribacterota bacterium]